MIVLCHFDVGDSQEKMDDDETPGIKFLDNCLIVRAVWLLIIDAKNCWSADLFSKPR